MSDHLLRVELDRDTVMLTAECLAGSDADCHRQCVNPEHEDTCNCAPDERQPSDYCNPCTWLNEDTGLLAELYVGDEPRITLNDGMPIKVRWDGDGFVWELAA